MYQVQLWNDTTHTVEYHSVPDAIDYDDAQHVIQSQYPQHTILAVIHKPPSAPVYNYVFHRFFHRYNN